MTKGEGLRELEKRLRDEPENLGLRVMVAGALREAGRHDDAVELYRSVAIAYRDRGRSQQATAVCRSILEIAPDDVRCQALLAALLAGRRSSGTGPHAVPSLVRRGSSHGPMSNANRGGGDPDGLPGGAGRSPVGSIDETPLPNPLPYHLADPTTKHIRKPSHDLPVSEGAKTRPGSDDGTKPEMTGIANAARRISASLIASTDDDGLYEELDVAAQLETRQRPLIETNELFKISHPPPTAPVSAIDFDDAATPPPSRESIPAGRGSGKPADGVPRESDEAVTMPVELLEPTNSVGPHVGLRAAAAPPVPSASEAVLASRFFAPLPIPRRAAVLDRFHRRAVRCGETVIRQGETEHGLVIVGRGALEVRVDRADGQTVHIASVGAGEYFGEVALLSRSPATAHVIAASDADVLLLMPSDFYEIAGRFPALWAQLKEVAERRAREHRAKLDVTLASP